VIQHITIILTIAEPNQTIKTKNMEKLTKNQLIELMKEGALLIKTYGVYSYWSLLLPNGTKNYNIRKNAPESISKCLCETIERNKDGYTLKLK